MIVPWNASWTAEARFDVRPCRWANGSLAMHQAFRPGAGKPLFAKPHLVRQRRSVAEMRCTVCGERTSPADRWWFGAGETRDGMFMTTEAPVHLDCARTALRLCPFLKGRESDVRPFPDRWNVVATMVGGAAVEQDFGVRISPGRTVVGSLKFAWPERVVVRAGSIPPGAGATGVNRLLLEQGEGAL